MNDATCPKGPPAAGKGARLLFVNAEGQYERLLPQFLLILPDQVHNQVDVFLVAIKRRIGHDGLAQDNQVVVVTELRLEILQALLGRSDHVGPKVFQQPEVVPVILHPLAQVVKIFRLGIFAHQRQRLPARAKRFFKPRAGWRQIHPPAAASSSRVSPLCAARRRPPQ